MDAQNFPEWVVREAEFALYNARLGSRGPYWRMMGPALHAGIEAGNAICRAHAAFDNLGRQVHAVLAERPYLEDAVLRVLRS